MKGRGGEVSKGKVGRGREGEREVAACVHPVQGRGDQPYLEGRAGDSQTMNKTRLGIRGVGRGAKHSYSLRAGGASLEYTRGGEEEANGTGRTGVCGLWGGLRLFTYEGRVTGGGHLRGRNSPK